VQFTDPATGREWNADHATPEYSLPAPADRLSPAHDLFGLAVIIAQLLMEGDHPYEGLPVDGEDLGIEANIRSGYSRLLAPERYVPIPGQLTLDLLPPPLAALVRRALGVGVTEPAQQPTPAQWETALRHAYNDLIGCRKDPDLHFYRQGLESCVWCYRREAGLGDHYPSAAAWN
jgi:DNA-binding helix-hairpin-helix protein with protein kinase domain